MVTKLPDLNTLYPYCCSCPSSIPSITILLFYLMFPYVLQSSNLCNVMPRESYRELNVCCCLVMYIILPYPPSSSSTSFLSLLSSSLLPPISTLLPTCIIYSSIPSSSSSIITSIITSSSSSPSSTTLPRSLPSLSKLS